jgi:hypothetical protein
MNQRFLRVSVVYVMTNKMYVVVNGVGLGMCRPVVSDINTFESILISFQSCTLRYTGIKHCL